MRGHVDAERLEQVAAFVAVALGRVDLVEQVAMAVVIGLQPRENSGFGHIRLPWRLETIRITARSEEHTSELQSLMRISYAVFCLKKKIQKHINTYTKQ